MRKMALSDLNLTLQVQFPHPTQAVVDFPHSSGTGDGGFAQGRMWSFNLIGALVCKIIHLGFLGVVDA